MDGARRRAAALGDRPFAAARARGDRGLGLTYKTVGFYWVKLNKGIGNGLSRDWPLLAERNFFTGLGFWTRANPEVCLLATRGHPKRSAGDVPKLLIAPRREHSRKPDETYERIERLLPGPYLELFARRSRPGWDGSATSRRCSTRVRSRPGGGRRGRCEPRACRRRGRSG